MFCLILEFRFVKVERDNVDFFQKKNQVRQTECCTASPSLHVLGKVLDLGFSVLLNRAAHPFLQTHGLPVKIAKRK
jgi:hypothetical protein